MKAFSTKQSSRDTRDDFYYKWY